MKKYKFENHNIEIVDPTIVRLQYSGEYGSNKVNVVVTLQTPDGSRFGGIELGVFAYNQPLDETQLMSWVTTQIEKHKEKK